MRGLTDVVPQPPDLCKGGRLRGISSEGWIAISVVLGFIGGVLVGICAASIVFKRQKQRMARNLLPEPVLTPTEPNTYAPAAKEKLFSPLRTSVNKLSVNESHESLNWQSSSYKQSVSSQYPTSPDSHSPGQWPFQEELHLQRSDSRDPQSYSQSSVGGSSRSDVYLVKDSQHGSLNRPLMSQAVPHPIMQVPAQPRPQPPSQVLTQPISQPITQSIGQTLTRVPSQNSAKLLTHHGLQPAAKANSQPHSAVSPLPSSWARAQPAAPVRAVESAQVLPAAAAPQASVPPASSLRPISEIPLAATQPAATRTSDYNPFRDPALLSEPDPASPSTLAHSSQPGVLQSSILSPPPQGESAATAPDPLPIPLMTPEPVLEECDSPTVSFGKGFAFPVLQGARESKEQESLGELLLSELDVQLQAEGQPPMLPIERKAALKLLLTERSSAVDVEAAMQKTLEIICRDRAMRTQ